MDKNVSHDRNINIEILTNAIIDENNMHIRIKSRKIDKCKDKKEVWMTDQLLEFVNRKNDLYIEFKRLLNYLIVITTKKLTLKHTKE